MIFDIFNELDKIYTYAPSLYQDIYENFFICFSNYIPIQAIQNILNEEDTDLAIDEIINIERFEKSDTDVET